MVRAGDLWTVGMFRPVTIALLGVNSLGSVPAYKGSTDPVVFKDLFLETTYRDS